MAFHNDLGKKGELLAENYLIDKGYSILEKNYRYLKAEIDIIALIDSTLVIVEVKTRSSNYFGNPEEAINKKKVELLTLAADNYVTTKVLDVVVRFDIISILKKEKAFSIEHIENAFLYF